MSRSAALMSALLASTLLSVPSAMAMSALRSDGSGGTTTGFNPERNAYFGDLHVHTRYSFDAFIFNTRATPDDAYNYAKGAPIKHTAGYTIRLEGPPLDFYAVTDHAEFLGMMDAMGNPDHPFAKHPAAERLIASDIAGIRAAFGFATARPRFTTQYPELADPAILRSAWAAIKESTERHYDPGTFTTFQAYEYTSSKDGRNLHRNVVFRGQSPETPFSAEDSGNPEDLWRWLDDVRAQGFEGFAIPHNSNGSDGIMFDTVTYDGGQLDAAYAELRMRNEPLIEISQVKGTSETHPSLSPNDEWANFELFETYIGTDTLVTKFKGGYVRDALKTGLELQEANGFNPYHFGITASSDTHNAGAPVEEGRFFGKIGLLDGLPERRGVFPKGAKMSDEDRDGALRFSKWSAAGLTGAWAEENTRESIYDAFRRKETFGTSGPRIKVRFFAGYGYGEDVLSRPDLVKAAYAGGVPMGGDLPAGDAGAAPTFIAWAVRDPESAWLQRVQVVKGWLENGKAQERVYDIACSDGLSPDPATHRCPDNGASVDLDTCAFSDDRGAVELKTAWKDPDFDPNQRAFYYVRVLENPTCRWSHWDAMRLNRPDIPGEFKTIQERAWSSPIWYVPRS
ncbi:MAG: DUF3604 domain-containing protein [Alphaproteobacteria bacterium]|nr:DUF3604 domain-containing protein [Alphaproteobacteria bacterium]